MANPLNIFCATYSAGPIEGFLHIEAVLSQTVSPPVPPGPSIIVSAEAKQVPVRIVSQTLFL